ncbi:MAG: nucleotidyltransferase family protein [Chthoniobacterales bacterium]
MNALILAAGYATRLYPLTLNKAKPLLPVGGKPIIEWLADHLMELDELQLIYIVTNDKFAKDFQAWADSYRARQPKAQFKIINDGSTSDANKLGAIGDINLVLTRENLLSSDLLVLAGDNLFSDSIRGFVDFARNTEATVALYDVGDLEGIKKYATVRTDSSGVITQFEEKPEKPTSTLAAIAMYFYSRSTLPLFVTYLASGNNPDQPGRFLQWLYVRKPVKTFEIKGQWLDIGSKETLEAADRMFSTSPK